MTTTQTDIFQLALGRILRLGSRPFQPGDIEEYERCRALIMDLAEDTDGLALPRHEAPLPGWNFGRGSSGVIE